VLEPTIYHTQAEYANHDAIDAVHLPGEISEILLLSERPTITACLKYDKNVRYLFTYHSLV
jgi:hypothetical protein